jgi:hypothetical protein
MILKSPPQKKVPQYTRIQDESSEFQFRISTIDTVLILYFFGRSVVRRSENMYFRVESNDQGEDE